MTEQTSERMLKVYTTKDGIIIMGEKSPREALYVFDQEASEDLGYLIEPSNGATIEKGEKVKINGFVKPAGREKCLNIRHLGLELRVREIFEMPVSEYESLLNQYREANSEYRTTVQGIHKACSAEMDKLRLEEDRLRAEAYKKENEIERPRSLKARIVDNIMLKRFKGE